MNKPTLILTVGLPRSGKSTWARSTGLPMVNPDSIRLAIHGKPYAPEHEERVWQSALLMVRSLFIAGHTKVVLDATNLLEFRRIEWYSPKWDTRLVVFKTPIDVCIQRAKDSKTEYLIPAIERMAAQMDPWPEHDLLEG